MARKAAGEPSRAAQKLFAQLYSTIRCEVEKEIKDSLFKTLGASTGASSADTGNVRVDAAGGAGRHKEEVSRRSRQERRFKQKWQPTTQTSFLLKRLTRL